MSDRSKKVEELIHAQPEKNTITDIEQLGLGAAVASLGYIFWIVGGMEMVERLAFYGVKTVATLYAKDPISKGGLGITMTSFGTILMTWAFVQSLLPIFTGALSDRYGYKQTIFLSTIVKIAGYLIMAFYPTYNGFFTGAIFLAAGTAIFKPGIQGTLVKATNRSNSSMAWGIFYQTVNIGGFLGPLVAGYMRKMAWSHVFLACAGIICFNFLFLLLYKDIPDESQATTNSEPSQRKGIIADSLGELAKTHVWTYLLIFSGFWFMFNALFDVLPAHIQDWTETGSIIKFFFGDEEIKSRFLKFFFVLNADGSQIQPEGLLNINAGMIMLTCFLFAYLSGKLRATTSMVLGTLLSSLALVLAGSTASGWIMLLAIVVFSTGEMFSSPKFSEFIGNFAPSNKKAMYLGFSQIPLAIGWTLEGKFGPMLYERFASKERFSRELLQAKGLSLEKISEIPQGEAFEYLIRFTGESHQVLTSYLYNSHNVGYVWYIMGAIGVVSAIFIYLYGQWIKTINQN